MRASDDDSFGQSGRSGFSLRAERLLVRVLLALRREARPSDSARSQRRAEELADIILTDFPRRVLPFGIAALVIIAVACSLPLMRDLARGDSGIVAASPAVLTVESGIRQKGAAMSDGLDALRTMVAPFSSDAAAAEPASGIEDRAPTPCDARAPFSKS